MPVIRISALPQRPDVDVRSCLHALCAELAREAGAPARAFWATWETLPPGHYVEGDIGAETQPFGTHPPIVEILAFEGRSAADIEGPLTRAAEVLARELRIEAGNVFVVYDRGSERSELPACRGGAVRRRAMTAGASGASYPRVAEEP